MISLAFNRGSMLHEASWLRKFEVIESQSESPLPGSATVLLSRHPESPLRAQIFEERKKVAAFVDWELARADTGDQCKGLDNIDTEDYTHRRLNQ